MLDVSITGATEELVIGEHGEWQYTTFLTSFQQILSRSTSRETELNQLTVASMSRCAYVFSLSANFFWSISVFWVDSYMLTLNQTFWPVNQVMFDDTHRVHHGQLWWIGLTGEVDLHPSDGVLHRGCSHLSLFQPFSKTRELKNKHIFYKPVAYYSNNRPKTKHQMFLIASQNLNASLTWSLRRC